jgi:hypothetical protein
MLFADLAEGLFTYTYYQVHITSDRGRQGSRNTCELHKLYTVHLASRYLYYCCVVMCLVQFTPSDYLRDLLESSQQRPFLSNDEKKFARLCAR